jgi:hypothetical protein
MIAPAWSAAQAPLPHVLNTTCAMRWRPDQAMPDFDDLALRQIARRPFARRALAASTVAIMLAGCAQSSGPAPIETSQASARQAELPICRPDPALLAPQSAPDCVFRRAELKTIDPDQWARLKIEYERQCYQKAEHTVRERLNRLQAANRCESEHAAR